MSEETIVSYMEHDVVTANDTKFIMFAMYKHAPLYNFRNLEVVEHSKLSDKASNTIWFKAINYIQFCCKEYKQAVVMLIGTNNDIPRMLAMVNDLVYKVDNIEFCIRISEPYSPSSFKDIVKKAIVRFIPFDDILLNKTPIDQFSYEVSQLETTLVSKLILAVENPDGYPTTVVYTNGAVEHKVEELDQTGLICIPSTLIIDSDGDVYICRNAYKENNKTYAFDNVINDTYKSTRTKHTFCTQKQCPYPFNLELVNLDTFTKKIAPNAL